MGIIKDKDCIETTDGRTICYDKESGKLYKFVAEEIKFSSLQKEDLFNLLQLSVYRK
jgi:hypothetical protein